MKLLLHSAYGLIMVALILGMAGCVLPAPISTPPAATTAPTSVGGPVSLTVFYTNDIHAHITPSKDKDIGGYARIATLVNQGRAQGGRVLLLDAGDALQGTSFWPAFEGRSTVEIMNALGYDAFTLGNHEFDKGPDLLARRLTEMQFPVLCANLEFAADSPMKTAPVKPYIIKNLNGLRVGLLGLTTEETPVISIGAFQGVTARSAIDTAQKFVAEMQPQCDLIIALTHLGVDEDYELAGKVDGIDLIVGGHSHTVLLKPSQAQNPSGQRVLIVQTGAYSRYLGRLDLTVDPVARPRITDYQGQLIELTNAVADDPQMKALVDKWQAQLPPPAMVGQMTVDLDMTIRGREAPAGNLFCDAILEYMATLPDPAQRPVIALYNAGGLRGGRIFPAGPITTEDIATWEPFGNTIVLLDLTAPQLKEVLESGAKGSVMQVAGLAYWIDNSRPAQEADDTARKITKPGQRIVRIVIGGQDIDLTDASKVYRVATNNFLAGGGDAAYTFLEGRNILDTGIYMTDILESYIRQHSPIAPKVEGRINIGTR